jgi:hypothetical protein
VVAWLSGMECGWAGPVAPGFKLSTAFFPSCRQAEHGEHVKETADPTPPAATGGCLLQLRLCVCAWGVGGRCNRDPIGPSQGAWRRILRDLPRAGTGGCDLCSASRSQRSRTRLAQHPDALLLMAHRDKHQGLEEKNGARCDGTQGPLAVRAMSKPRGAARGEAQLATPCAGDGVERRAC